MDSASNEMGDSQQQQSSVMIDERKTNDSQRSGVPAFTSSFALPSALAAHFTPLTTANEALTSTVVKPRASLKRSMADLDDNDDESDVRAYKRLDNGSDDDEDDGEDGDDEDFYEHKSHFGNNEVDNEDSFFDLLTHFANLHVPTSSTKPEACPVCSHSFPLSELAEHVYECLKIFDDVERKEQERLDEKMARSLMEKEMHHMLDRQEIEATLQRHADRFAAKIGTACKDGAECTRNDAQHFILQSHPSVYCPLCAQSFEVYEINAHINLCLVDPDAASKMKEKKDKEKKNGDATMSDETSKAVDTNDAFTAVRESQPTLWRTESDEGRRLPIHGDNSDDEANNDNDDDELIVPLRALSQSPLNLPQLTIEQASAMASMVIARREALSGRRGAQVQAGAGGANDASLAQLLDTFKTLGFTQEGLTRLREQGQSQQQQASSSATQSQQQPPSQ